MSKPSLWVTRPAPGNAATAAALERAGISVVAAPVLEIAYVDGATLPAEPPRLVVFVSAHAVEGLERVWPATLSRRKVRAYAVGRQTGRAVHRAGWDDIRIPSRQTADGLWEMLARERLEGVQVWLPAGNRPGSARESLPKALAERGAEVHVLPVYAVTDRVLPDDELNALAAAQPGVVIYHSPSAVEAVFSPAACPEVSRVRDQARSVAIGPSTAAALRRAGATDITECASPDDEALIEAVLQRKPA